MKLFDVFVMKTHTGRRKLKPGMIVTFMGYKPFLVLEILATNHEHKFELFSREENLNLDTHVRYLSPDLRITDGFLCSCINCCKVLLEP